MGDGTEFTREEEERIKKKDEEWLEWKYRRDC